MSRVTVHCISRKLLTEAPCRPPITQTSFSEQLSWTTWHLPRAQSASGSEFKVKLSSSHVHSHKCATQPCPPTSKMDPKWSVAPCYICIPKWVFKKHSLQTFMTLYVREKNTLLTLGHGVHTKSCEEWGGYFCIKGIRGRAAQMGLFSRRNPYTWVRISAKKSLQMGPLGVRTYFASIPREILPTNG